MESKSDVIQLMYTSVASQPMPSEELCELLAKSRKNNERLGVTGLLIYQYRTFTQVLEGPRETVEPLYRRIAADPRHTDVEILHRGTIDRRSFGDWSMGFFPVNANSVRALPGFADLLGDGLPEKLLSTDRSIAQRLLRAFREGRWRQNVETGLALA